MNTLTTSAGTESNVYDSTDSLLLQTNSTNGSMLHLGDTELHQAAGSSTVTSVRTYAGPGRTPLAERTTELGSRGVF